MHRQREKKEPRKRENCGERENIRKRQEQGIAAAKARGVWFGRPEKTVSEDFGTIVKEWESGSNRFDEAVEQCGFREATFYRWMK